MALIRGRRGGFPCPICLVPRDEMCTGVVGDLCTTKSMEELYKIASEMDTAEEREALLKGYSARYIKVCKVCINQCYIYTV